MIDVYDALGTVHPVTLDWVQNAASDWTVSISAAGSSLGGAEVKFGQLSSGNPVPEGTVGDIKNATGSVSTGGYSAGGAATLSFSNDFGSGSQSIVLNMGTYGQTNGVTQYAGTDYNLRD